MVRRLFFGRDSQPLVVGVEIGGRGRGRWLSGGERRGRSEDEFALTILATNQAPHVRLGDRVRRTTVRANTGYLHEVLFPRATRLVRLISGVSGVLLHTCQYMRIWGKWQEAAGCVA